MNTINFPAIRALTRTLCGPTGRAMTEAVAAAFGIDADRLECDLYAADFHSEELRQLRNPLRF